ncbi:MAG: AAA family ATPase [Candidatus Andersenbacteria bacterium]
MHLKSLSLNGFKSFALPTTLEFTRGVTAIVGPNGSGKSNVADAARWVLGEMSLKTLRGKKSEDVIFAGSRLRAGHSMAEVTLLFDNADGRLPVDAAEVAMTRRLFRSGDSEYEINGTQVRLRDLHELLTKAGLGERSYAVIGQGQVDAILRASAAERKEFFEEAAGVKEFQSKKEQTLRKLETTRRNLVRVDDLVKEIRPRLASLKRQADRASLREQLQKELHTKSLVWFGAELAAIDAGAESDLKQLAQVTRERAAFEQKIVSLEKSHTAAEEQALAEERTLTQNRLSEARQTLSELAAEQAELNRRQASLQERELPADLSMLPTQIVENEARLAQLTRRAASLVPEVEKFRREVTQAEEESTTTANKVKQLREKLSKGHPKKTLDQREIAQLLKELNRAYDHLIASLKTIQTLDDLPEILQLAAKPKVHLDQLLTRVERSQPLDSTTLNQQLDHVLESRDEILAQLAGSREQLARRETEHSLLQKQIAQLTRTINDHKRQVTGSKKGGAKGAKQAALQGLKDELKTLAQKIAVQDEQVRSLEKELVDFDTQSQTLRTKNRQGLEAVKELRTKLSASIEKQSLLNIAKGKYDVRREDLLSEARDLLGSEAATTLGRGGGQTLEQAKRDTLKATLEQLRKKVDQAGGIDETVLTEFKETQERFDFLTTQSQDLASASNKLREVIEQLDTQIHQRFAKSLEQINREFDKAFKVLFNGGTAKLTPVRAPRKKATPEAELEETSPETQEDEITQEVEKLRASDGIVGVDIKANPPGKKLQGIGMLSGGEKALTSIALLSGILATKPSPFVILDEVDAALDEANSRRFAKIVKSLAGKTQFITITHNRETMRQAGILYGVTMQKDGVSKLLSVKLDTVKADGSLAKTTA